MKITKFIVKAIHDGIDSDDVLLVTHTVRAESTEGARKIIERNHRSSLIKIIEVFEA